MSDLIQAVKGTALSVAEYFTPILKESKFKKTGVLTPEEFVIAGDHLVHQCPTWSWSSVDSSSLRKTYLPPDKQYLVTKSVPCYKRCKDIEYCTNDEKLILTENDDEGWLDTHHSQQTTTVVNDLIEDLTISDDVPETSSSNISNAHAEQSSKNAPDAGTGDDDDDDAEDMDKFMNMIEDDDPVSLYDYSRCGYSFVVHHSKILNIN